MKLWVLSDVHIDVNRRFPLRLPQPYPDHDAVIIAGDICQGMTAAVRFIVEHELNSRPVLFVGGNHEFYGHDRHAELANGRAEAAKHPNVHVLERDAVLVDGIEFLGCTLWTDYEYAGVGEQARAMHWAARRMSDHRLIFAGKGAWSPQEALAEHLISREWLSERLTRKSSPTQVVVTHHAPSRQSVLPRYRDDLLTAAFASHLDELVGKAALWVHGHLHAPADYRLGGCRVVANPRGYVSMREDQAFNPAFTVDVGAT